MAEQIYYEDVTEGMTIPALEKVVTSRSLVMYCAAYEDFAEIHHDKDAAQQAGFPNTVVARSVHQRLPGADAYRLDHAGGQHQEAPGQLPASPLRRRDGCMQRTRHCHARGRGRGPDRV